MNNLFSLIVSSIKYRFGAIYSRLRYLTPSYLLTRGMTTFRQWLYKLFDVKPRHQKDYYQFFNYLISKRLVQAVIVITGLLSMIYLVSSGIFTVSTSQDDIKATYKYNSFLLRTTSGNVKILGRGGYTAFVGNVNNGFVQGQGKLYNDKEQLVYEGTFEKNKYEGDGILYYPETGVIRYTGGFHENLFSGDGILNTQSGTRNYEGQFWEGYMEGEGILYDKSGKEIFTGTFHNNGIRYNQLLGLTASEINEKYFGTQYIYNMDNSYGVALEDINCIYIYTERDSLDPEMKAEEVVVVNGQLPWGNTTLSTIDDLKKVFGQPKYEGYSYFTFGEAIGLDYQIKNKIGPTGNLNPVVYIDEQYAEYGVVTGFDRNQEVYVYGFIIDDLEYTFITDNNKKNFYLYTIK